MLSFKQFLKEDIDQVITNLSKLGYNNILRKSSKRINVLVDENRVKVLEKIAKELGGTYDKKPTATSSVGVTIVDGISIYAKPASKQGKGSAGLDNEDILIDVINQYTKTGPINIVFKDDKNNREVLKIIGANKVKGVGTDTVGRKKADVILIDHKNTQYPISIKKDNAETWESADKYFGKEAEKIVDNLVSKGTVRVVNQGSYVTLEPNVAVKATQKEKKDVIFGSDILPNGFVLTRTFSEGDFTLEDSNLIITVSNIITNLNNVPENKDVYFLIRNDKTRRSVRKYPGLRVLAVYKKRLNNNVKIVDR